jgi:hypothetical protein
MTWWPIEQSLESDTEFTPCPICETWLFLDSGNWFENSEASCQDCCIELHKIGPEEFEFFLEDQKISLEELLRRKKLKSFQ